VEWVEGQIYGSNSRARVSIYMSSTLSLKKKDPAEKLLQALQIGFRFVDRKGRYILQTSVVINVQDRQENTWVDIPLCPEVYGK
jgi:hypothetical protein